LRDGVIPAIGDVPARKLDVQTHHNTSAAVEFLNLTSIALIELA
jgi:hypothetical protein